MDSLDYDKMGIDSSYARLKYDECYNRSISYAAKASAVNVIFGGIGSGVSKLFAGPGGAALERHVITSVDSVVPQVLAESTLSQKIIFKTADQVSSFGLNVTAALIKCIIRNDGNTQKCDVRMYAKEARDSMIIGFMMERAKLKISGSDRRVLTNDELRQVTKKVTADPEFRQAQVKFLTSDSALDTLAVPKVQTNFRPFGKYRESTQVNSKPN